LLPLLLAACSTAGGDPDQNDASASSSVPVPAPVNRAVPEAQQEYFSDGEVSLAEYQEAFATFVQCAADAGLGSDLREQGRDEVTGVISYSTQTLLLPPGQFDGTKLNDCYQDTFVYVEVAFQTSDPTVLAAQPQEQLAFFNENIRPCLAKIGIEVPDDLEFNDENWLQLNDEATRAFQDGRCDTGED
jgi:hypothetical protein